jgi:hypothetical protein
MMAAAAECAFVVGYLGASACPEPNPWFLVLPILMYHQPTDAFCMTVAVLGLVEAYDTLPLAVRTSAKYALASAAVETIRDLQRSAALVAGDLGVA